MLSLFSPTPPSPSRCKSWWFDGLDGARQRFLRHVRVPSARYVTVLTLGWALALSGCASLPTDVQRPVSTALSNPTSTLLGRLVAQRASQASTKNDSGFALLGRAELAFSSRLALIQAAQKTLDLQYYAILADDTTTRLLDAVRDAAGRGVRVRILLDDFNTSGKNAEVLMMAFEDNVELRLFNPLPAGRGSALTRIVSSLHDAARLQRRMHNKMLVADNSVAIMGGRNLGQAYFGRDEGSNFVDVDIMAAGRIARDLSGSFDQYWNDPQAYPAQSLMTAAQLQDLLDRVKPSKPAPTSTIPMPLEPDTAALRALPWSWAPSVMMVDKPSKISADADATELAQDTTVDGLLQLMGDAKRDLLIVSPYFVPGPRMMEQLAAIRSKGVRIRVLTNSLASNDAAAAHVGYARYRRELLGLGIALYEMRAELPGSLRSVGSLTASTGKSQASLHAKLVVIDERLLVIGSMNLDLRSQLQNSEVALVISSKALAGEAITMIEPALASGAWHVELEGDELRWRAPKGSDLADATQEPDTSFGLRLLLKVLGPLAPDEML